MRRKVAGATPPHRKSQKYDLDEHSLDRQQLPDFLVVRDEHHLGGFRGSPLDCGQQVQALRLLEEVRVLHLPGRGVELLQQLLAGLGLGASDQVPEQHPRVPVREVVREAVQRRQEGVTRLELEFGMSRVRQRRVHQRVAAALRRIWNGRFEVG